MISAVMLFLFIFVSALSSPPALADSPTRTARVFFQSLGFMNYKRSWECLSAESQNQWLIRLRDYFIKKGQAFRVDELRYMVDCNHEGHRGILFYELFSNITTNMGVKASSFKDARVALEEKKGDTARVRLIVEEKKAVFDMVKEEGEWKVVYYPR